MFRRSRSVESSHSSPALGWTVVWTVILVNWMSSTPLRSPRLSRGRFTVTLDSESHRNSIKLEKHPHKDLAHVHEKDHASVPLHSIVVAVAGTDVTGHSFEATFKLIQEAQFPLVLEFSTGGAPASDDAESLRRQSQTDMDFSDERNSAHFGAEVKPGLRSRDKRVSFYEIREKRHCTDPIFLLLFTLFWVGMLGIAYVGYQRGDPHRLLYGVDHSGNVCGQGKFKGKNNVHYPQLHFDLLRVYLSSSAEYLNNGKLVATQLDASAVSFFGVCVEKCPLRGDVTCTDIVDPNTNAITQKCYPPEPLDTYNVLFRCLPVDDVVKTHRIECAEPKDAIEAVNCNSYLNCQAQLEANIIQNKTGGTCRVARITQTEQREKLAISNPVFDLLTASGAVVKRWFGDLALSMVTVLLAGGVLSLVLSFLWMVALQKYVWHVVWFSFWFCYVALIGVVIFVAQDTGLFAKDAVQYAEVARSTVTDVQNFINSTVQNSIGEYFGDDDARQSEQAALEAESKEYSEWATRILMFSSIAMLFLMLHWRKRVRLAILILEEASRAIQRMPMLLLFPVLPTVLTVVLAVYFITVASYLASIGSIGFTGDETGLAVTDPNDQSRLTFNSTTNGTLPFASRALQLTNEDTLGYVLFYHFFGMLWTKLLLKAMTLCVVAGAISDWYFCRGDDNRERLQSWPVWRALKTTVRYHMGSLCFGSLIISICFVIRAAIHYLNRRTRELQKHHFAIRFVMRAVLCCWHCFEKCIKFISNSGYIIVAMRGKNFCHASVDAFRLIFKNAGRVGTVGIITSFVLILGEVIVVVICASVVFVFTKDPIDVSQVPLFSDMQSDLTEVTNPLLPVAMTMLLAYAVCNFCFSVYRMAVDTILLCFCEDEKLNADGAQDAVNDGQKAYFASKRLTEYLNGEAKVYAFKHLTQERRGVHWVEKGEEQLKTEGHAEAPRHCCFGTNKPDTTTETSYAQNRNPLFSHNNTMRNLHQGQVAHTGAQEDSV